MTVLAAAGIAAAVWLSWTPGVPRPGRRSRVGRSLPVPWLVVTAAGVVWVGPVALVALGIGWVTRALVGVRARRREAEATAERVLETCELLAADVAAGQPPARALASAAAAWPTLGPAAEAGVLGGDVPAALRELATTPGAGELRLVAAGWAVSHRTGSGLADTLDRVATSIRAERATRRVVAGELASARATARLVAALPLLVLLLGTGSGTSPWAFLLGTGPGLLCLAAGLALGAAGLWWIERIADGVTR